MLDLSPSRTRRAVLGFAVCAPAGATGKSIRICSIPFTF